MKKLLLSVILFSVGIISYGQIYVNINATGANNGTSWADAYTDLHSATFNATSGQMIWVAAGIYTPTRSFTGSIPANNTQKTFRVSNNVQVYGGFNGTESSLNQRNWKTNLTILEGDLGGGSKIQNIVRFDGNDNTTVLDGFIIRNGNSTTNVFGGGIYSSNASPTIKNCSIENNNTEQHGGGAYFTGGAPKVINCTFKANTTVLYDGAGLYITNATSAEVTNCLFNGNNAARYAGAMVIQTTPTSKVYNCTFVNNVGPVQGKAVIISSSGASAFKNCIFYNNYPNTTQGDEVFKNGTSSYTVTNTYADAGSLSFSGNNGLTNIISGNIRFTDFSNDDFTLSCESPAINTGDTTGLGLPATDLNNTPRVFGSNVDMGALEASITEIGIEASKTSICLGDYVVLRGICDNSGYSWDNGIVNGQPFSPTTTTTYTCTGTTISDSKQITIEVLNITDENVSAPSTVCQGSTTTVTLANSAVGGDYFLRDNITNEIVDGPITGTGGALNFTSGNINASTTYNIIGSPAANVVTNNNYALDFDGSNDFVSTTVPTNFNYNTSYTIEGWVKAPLPGSSASRPIVFIGTSTSSDIEIYVQQSSNNLYIVHNRGNAGTFSFAFYNNVPNNVLYHLAVVFNGTTVEVFYNGVSRGINNIAAPVKTTGSIMQFGGVSNTNWGTFKLLGQLNDIRLWNTVRSSSEILSNKDNCVSQENGLIANYRFDEGSGLSTYDAVNGTTATLNNMDAISDWVLSGNSCGSSVESPYPNGYALDFDGANDKVKTSFFMPTTNAYTIEAWIYPRSGNYDRFISNFKGSGSAGAGEILIDSYNAVNNGTGIRFSVQGGSIGDANQLTLNTWNHIACVFNNGSLALYVNGFEVTTGTASTTTYTAISAPFSLGEDNIIGSAEYFNGKMDEVRFWNKALNQTEIMDNMNSCLTGTENNLVAYYNFEDGQGDVVKDLTAGRNHGVMQNMDVNTDWIEGKFACYVNCDIEMTQTVTISPVSVDNTTTQNANEITANQAGASYRWLDCDNANAVISGETAQTFTASVNGSYAVEVTLNGCTDTSACVLISSVGINDIKTNNMSISPNPVKDYLFVNGIEQIVKATIYTINGSLVQNINTQDNKINVSNLSQGMYILVVQTDKGITQNKFIKE